MEPVATAADRLKMSRQWLTSLCRDGKVPGATMTSEGKWVVPFKLKRPKLKLGRPRKADKGRVE